MSRERTIGLVAAALLVLSFSLLWLLPPLPSHPSWLGQGAPNDRPTRGGTFTFFQEVDLRTLDPLGQSDEVSAMAIKLLFETLIEHDSNLELVPRLARSLPAVSADGLRYTFVLREGVRFHNGRELVAEDVRWSMEKMLHPSTASAGAGFFIAIDGAEEYLAGRADHVRGIHVLDEHTIEFELSRPDTAFLHCMGLTYAAPVPRENYERFGDDVSRHPIGTGAFVLESWEPGMYLTFRRNRDFYRPGEPYVDRMVFELSLSRGAAFMRFLAGQLDHIHRFAPTDYLWLTRQEGWTPYLDAFTRLDTWGVQMNTELPPFDNRHVRRAVAFAIDFETWNRVRARRLNHSGQPLPAGVMGHDSNLSTAHHFDLERAKREMILAGHPVDCADEDQNCSAQGLSEDIEVWIGEGATGQSYGALIQNDLARIGLRVRLRPAAFPLFLAQTGKPRQAQMLFSGWLMDHPDPSSMLDPLFHSRSATETNASNRSFYRNPELDALLDAAHLERDPQRRAAIYREASRILVEDAPWAFVLNNSVTEARQAYVRGYRPNRVWNELYRDVWLDLPKRRAAFARRSLETPSWALLLPSGFIAR